MVMKSMMRKNLLRTIRKSLGRYIAIMAIIALGSGIFVGLLSSKTDMIATGRQYMDEQNMFDVRLLSSYGWSEKELKRLAELPGIEYAEGSQMMDVLGSIGTDGKENVYQLYSMPEKVNQVRLTAGRMPEAPNECLLDDRMISEEVIGKTFYLSANNKQETADQLNEAAFTVVGLARTPIFMDMTRGNSTLGNGSVASFLFLPKEAFHMDYYTDVYVTLTGGEQAYTDAYDAKIDLWTEENEQAVQSAAQQRFESIKAEAEEKYADGCEEYQNGLQELEDAKDALIDAYGKLTEGQAEIDENRAALTAGRQKLDSAKETLSQKKQELEDGASELEQKKEEAYSQIDKTSAELQEKKRQIEENLSAAEAGLVRLETGLTQLNEGISKLEDGIAQLKNLDTEEMEKQLQELSAQREELQEKKNQLEQGIASMEESMAQIETDLPAAEANLTRVSGQIDLLNGMITELQAQIEQSGETEELLEQLRQSQTKLQQLQELQQSLQESIFMMEQAQDAIRLQLPQVQAGLEEVHTGLDQLSTGIAHIEDALKQSGNLDAMCDRLQELQKKKIDLLAQREELTSAIGSMQDGLVKLGDGFDQLDEARQEADVQFASAEAEIHAGRQQIWEAEAELEARSRELRDGQQALQNAQKELDQGRREYADQKADADRKIADGQKDLEKAQKDLEDAREKIDTMDEVKVYLLGPGTNSGYISLDSNSDIVQGVSRVFPAFFLLVAALVCITTMTRMVEEERTQIGTLKALGYRNGSIIGKYLIYAGSAAVLGCGLGVVVGSVIFPNIIWFAYKIMLSLEPTLSIQFNIPLCLVVVASYTAVILLVTWYTCRYSLKEVPAELIRPKAPKAGKKILLEYIPIWKRMGFLNKVTLRNIFRYHQRLLMMLVGIGGCTALLVTGFGIGDSIQNIVSYQYEEVTRYDMQVQFGEGQTHGQQQDFLDAVADETDSVEFVHQSSVDVLKDGRMKSLYMIAADAGIQNVFDLHAGNAKLSPPAKGEALLTVGFAEEMGIHIGDTIVAHSKDQEDVTVRVSGIFDNNINNYLIIAPETLEDQWTDLPEPQLAFVMAGENQDVHSVGAYLSGLDDVTAVMISQDMADQVGSMLDAMDMIVVTVVICAGILAVIVLYNLTNINITERLREIATIKVLGFRSNETAAYVFKENLLLSGMGCVLGLGFGKLLLDFVMSQIKVDSIWFQSRVTGLSILWSMVITMLMACLVDFILYFRLEKINMAEALKSVE